MNDQETGRKTFGPYVPCRRIGDWLVTSGQLGVDLSASEPPKPVQGGTRVELRQALANLSSVLGAQGATLADVVKATVYVVDMGDFAMVNEVWPEYFSGQVPARSTVGVAGLPFGARVEVEAWAFVGDR